MTYPQINPWRAYFQDLARTMKPGFENASYTNSEHARQWNLGMSPEQIAYEDGKRRQAQLALNQEQMDISRSAHGIALQDAGNRQADAERRAQEAERLQTQRDQLAQGMGGLDPTTFGIGPDVWSALPPEMQAQVAMNRTPAPITYQDMLAHNQSSRDKLNAMVDVTGKGGKKMKVPQRAVLQKRAISEGKDINHYIDQMRMFSNEDLNAAAQRAGVGFHPGRNETMQPGAPQGVPQTPLPAAAGSANPSMAPAAAPPPSQAPVTGAAAAPPSTAAPVSAPMTPQPSVELPPGLDFTEGTTSFDKETFSATRNLRQDFEKEIAPVMAAKEAHAQMIAALNEETGVGDVTAVYKFMSALDPRSTVREGERDSVIETGGLKDRVRAKIQGYAEGDKLPPKVREEISRLSEQIMAQVHGKQSDIETKFKDISAQHGLSPNLTTRQVWQERGMPDTYSPGTGPGAAVPGANTNEVINNMRATMPGMAQKANLGG